MPAPQLTFQASRTGISSAAGFDSVSVTFSADMAYTQFQCRATKSGEAYGVDVGALVASFSYTPANTPRTFEIYDERVGWLRDKLYICSATRLPDMVILGYYTVE